MGERPGGKTVRKRMGGMPSPLPPEGPGRKGEAGLVPAEAGAWARSFTRKDTHHRTPTMNQAPSCAQGRRPRLIHPHCCKRSGVTSKSREGSAGVEESRAVREGVSEEEVLETPPA